MDLFDGCWWIDQSYHNIYIYIYIHGFIDDIGGFGNDMKIETSLIDWSRMTWSSVQILWNSCCSGCNYYSSPNWNWMLCTNHLQKFDFKHHLPRLLFGLCTKRFLARVMVLTFRCNCWWLLTVLSWSGSARLAVQMIYTNIPGTWRILHTHNIHDLLES